jgi:hypothetical protein
MLREAAPLQKKCLELLRVIIPLRKNNVSCQDWEFSIILVGKKILAGPQ